MPAIATLFSVNCLVTIEPKPIMEDDIFEQIEQKLTEESSQETEIIESVDDEPKHIVENGKTFVDITSQYVKKEVTTESPVEDETSFKIL